MAPSVVAVGNVNVDLIFAHTPILPSWGVERLVSNFEMRVAGSAGYFALAAARLGIGCGLVAGVGDDLFGDFMLRELKRRGVKYRIRKERQMGSGVSVSIVRGDGERAFISYAGNLSEWSLGDIERYMEFISRARALYYGGYFFMRNLMAEKAEALMRRLKGVGVMTAFDTGWDPEGWAPRTIVGIRRVLKYVDVFLPNADEARNIAACPSPERAAQKILSYGPELVAIKLGPRGCVVAQGHEVARVRGYRCRAFDSTGAGDAFNAGFMLGRLRRWDLWKTAEFANAIGALTVSSRRQGPNRFPTRRDVTEFQQGRSHHGRPIQCPSD